MALEDITKYSAGLLDFHNHSTYSDGGDTPTELVQRANKYGVSAMALTDHHGIGGLPEFRDACERYGILGIPLGIEISARLPEGIVGKKDNEAPDLIILGKNANEEPMNAYQVQYFEYMEKIFLPATIQGLESVGFDFPEIDLKKECESFHCPPDAFHSFVHHRNNMNILIDHVLNVKDEDDKNISEEDIKKRPVRFANKYLYASGKPAYFTRVGDFDVKDAIKLSEDMNCKLFIAHPGGSFGSLNDEALEYYINEGVHGIEVRNYFNDEKQNAKFDGLASKHNLIRSGGSDCHGDKGPFKIGCYDRTHNQLPSEVLEELWCGLPA